MYCPPESGNIEPNSANAKQAQSEISAPNTHTRRNSTGCGNGPAMSFAVRKIDEPITPLTSSNTESSSPSPRTSVGFEPDGVELGGMKSGSAASVLDKTGIGFIIQCPVHRTIQAPSRNAGRSPQSSRRRLADP